jgi:hypothetical protein
MACPPDPTVKQQGYAFELCHGEHDYRIELFFSAVPARTPGEHQSGTAATFDEARVDFEGAWQVFLSKRTEADFQEWRDHRDWTARKYALWDTGERLPPNEWEPGKPCSIYVKCRCGEIFNNHRLEDNLVHVPHISAGRDLR